MNPTICGLGTCSVTSDGLYQCSCQDGAMITGSNTDGSLTCIGNALFPPKKIHTHAAFSPLVVIHANSNELHFSCYCDYSVEA